MANEAEELLDFFTQIPRNKEGKELKHLAKTIGKELDKVWKGLHNVEKSKFPSFATGYELDYIGDLVTIPRVRD